MRSPRHLGRWLALIAVIAVVAGIFYYRRVRPTEVIVQAVARGRAVEAVYATGTVEPLHTVVVKARISEHVGTILVEAGDVVTAGQLLARIENPVREFALAQGETELTRARTQAGSNSPQLANLEAQARAAKAQLELARTELSRSEKLVNASAATQQELDSARTKVAMLTAQAEAADDAARSSRIDLRANREKLTTQVKSLASEADAGAVTSPIAGIVLRRDVEPGEVVSANQTLFQVADVSELLIELHVDEADIARIRDGATASTVALSFYAFPGQAFSGKVVTIMPEPDRVRRSYTVKVRLDEPPEGLRIGMTAEANLIVTRNDNALLLPAEAVTGGQAWFVVDGKAVQRPVTLGIVDLVKVEVLSGANEGDLAIVNAEAAKLKPGRRVHSTVRPVQ